MKRQTMLDELKKATVGNWYRCTALGSNPIIFVHEGFVEGNTLLYDTYEADGARGSIDRPLQLPNQREYEELERLSEEEIENFKKRIDLAQSSSSATPSGGEAIEPIRVPGTSFVMELGTGD